MNKKRARVAVVGAGAIGVLAAAHLAEDSCDIVLCRRGTGNAMSVIRDGERRMIAGRVATDPAAATAVDWVLLATKAVDDPGQWLDRLVGSRTKIAVLQNGIELRQRVSEWAPPQRVLPVTVTAAADRTGADEVTIRHLRELVTETSPLASGFAALFGASLPVRASQEYVSESWRKLMLNVVVNPVTAITGGTAASCVDADLLPLSMALLVETFRVAQSRGIDLAPTEVDVVVERIRPLQGVRPSMQADLRAGRPLEHEFITGAVIRNAERAQVSVPTVRAVHALVGELDRQTRRGDMPSMSGR